MADSTGRLPKSELAYDCIVNESRRHQPTYADGRAAHRGDMVAIAGEPGMRMYKVEALHPDRCELQITDTLGNRTWMPCHALVHIQKGFKNHGSQE